MWIGGCRGVHMSDAVQRVGFEITGTEQVTQLTMVTEVLTAIKAIASKPSPDDWRRI